jgi:hypothetical protein
MNETQDREVYRRLHHEMMRNMVWEHKKPNGMTSRLLTRAETNAFQHEMLTMSQILNTLAPTRMHEGWSGHETDHLRKLRDKLKELNINISYMENEEFAMIKDDAGLRELAARNLKQAHAFAYELKHILHETEEIERDLSAIPGYHEKAKSRFRWEDGLLHRELQGVIDNISNLVYALLPGYMR